MLDGAGDWMTVVEGEAVVDEGTTVLVVDAAVHAAEMLITAWGPHFHSITESPQGHSSPGLSTSHTGALEPSWHPIAFGFAGQLHGSNNSDPELHRHFWHGI